ncbi:MAG: ribosome assembly cofactor RimP [Flavobacteriaceae bacterium]|nr:ribosome assembly cofactor RimP [Flavobacteriaceae bacterium]
MLKDKVYNLLQDCLKERTDLFLIEFNIQDNNAIKVIIDGDNGVLVEDCIYVSRAIEHNLDRDKEDFSLEVASAGAASPLAQRRQYKKNLGRTLKVKTLDNQKFEGIITKVLEEAIVLSWKAREPKPVGKGKITVEKEAEIALEDIKEAKVKIKF